MHIGRQFYQCSKNIMKTYDEDFLSQSDHQDIQKMVRKDKKTHLKKQIQIQNSNFHTIQNIRTSEVANKLNQVQVDDFRPQKHLASNIQNNKKLVFKIVKLYLDFFNNHKSQTKAEEILHIYKKKLCNQSIIVPTLFCWLNDWISKDFSIFIKNQITQLSHHSNSLKPKKKQKIRKSPKYLKQENQSLESMNLRLSSIFEPPCSQSSKNKHQRRLKKQIQPDMFFSIDLNHGKSREDLYEKIDKISMLKKNSIEKIEQSEVLSKSKSRKNISGPNTQVYLTIDGSDEKSKQKSASKDRRRLTINVYEISNLLPISIKQQSVQEPVKKQPFHIEQPDSTPINRQVLIGALYEKYFNLYKNLQSVLPDLDIQYIKQIKRNDRRPQIKKRIKQISRVLTRTQPLIKASVEEYELSYFERKRKKQKNIKNKKNRYKNKEKQFVNYPETVTTTRYGSLDYIDDKIQTKITSEKKINLSFLLRKQATEQTNLQKIYLRKREQKQKQVFSLNRPIKFQFNLPSLPEKQRNMQTRFKQQSKIVLIQSGRYKLLDTLESSDLSQMTNRKKKLNNYSIDLSEMKQKNASPIISRQNYSQKKIAQFDKRSVSILQIITKKKKDFAQPNAYSSVHKQAEQSPTGQSKQSTVSNRKIRSIRNDQYAQKQFKQILQSLDTNDYGLISAWQKGEQTPQIN